MTESYKKVIRKFFLLAYLYGSLNKDSEFKELYKEFEKFLKD